MWRKYPRMENATSLAVSIKNKKIYITLGEQTRRVLSRIDTDKSINQIS